MLIRKGMSIMLAGALLSTSAVASEYILSNGISQDYNLPPGIENPLSNPTMWTISATCHFTTSDTSTTLMITVKKSHWKVNGQDLKTGTVFNLNVQNGQEMKLTAFGGAKVLLLNKGAHNLKAHCLDFSHV